VADNPARGKAHGRNDRRHRTIVDDTDRTRERSPEARPISKCLERPPPQSSFPGGRSPRRKSIGAGHANGQQAGGPGRAEMLTKRVAIETVRDPVSRAELSRECPPELGSKPAKGVTPGAPPGGKREEPVRPARSRRFEFAGPERRVRETAATNDPGRTRQAQAGAG